MTRYVPRVLDLGDGIRAFAPDGVGWDFLYKTSTTKADAWNVGDHVRLPDGREFVYAKSAAACSASRGAEITATGYVSITTATVSAAIGARSVTIPAATHAALTQDELAGGYLLIFDGSSDNYTTVRGIVGNDSAAANALFVVYLDAALTYAVTASTSKFEVYQNPYAALQTGTSVSYAKAGVPAAYVSAANTYFWVQVKGFTWCPPQSGLDGKQRAACWRHDGSIDTLDNGVEDSAYVSSQIAGVLMEGSASGNGPLLFLK